MIKVCENANKLSIDDSTCPECFSRLLKVEYRPVILFYSIWLHLYLIYCFLILCLIQENTKFVDGESKKIGCIFCSSDFSGLVEKRFASAARRGRGVRARGRGRGRGRGRRGPKDKMAQLAAYFVWIKIQTSKQLNILSIKLNTNLFALVDLFFIPFYIFGFSIRPFVLKQNRII